ncbi:hypothetical protein TNCV_2391851 [Trichonephila clavipes]|nr:hypothetical protein TNCV_2391851 [Trichonephila clavipes]
MNRKPRYGGFWRRLLVVPAVPARLREGRYTTTSGSRRSRKSVSGDVAERNSRETQQVLKLHIIFGVWPVEGGIGVFFLFRDDRRHG